jgi:hypothetical protein
MKTLFNRLLCNWFRSARVAVFLVAAAAACAVAAHAQTPPYSLFEYSTLTASGDKVTATWVPVITSKGTIFKNVTLLFEVDSSGNLTLAPGYPEVVPSPAPVVSAFKAGNYAGPASVYHGDFVIVVAGPGVTVGGATEWTVTAPTGVDIYTYPGSGTWYVGPLATNPLAARLKAAGITSTAWSYGVAGSQWRGAWAANTLVGVSQVGNTITFVSFTNPNGDHSEPVDQITYTLSQ